MAESTRCRPGLGTYVQVSLRDPRPEPWRLGCIEAAFDAVARVERLMSFHRADSALTRLNQAPAGATLTLHPWLIEVLSFAAELHDATDGLFDPGVADTLVDWALLPRHARAVPARDDRDEARASIRDLEFLGDDRVRLRRATCLDLGGIAKGYAVDRAIEALVAEDATQAVVDAGGDLRVLGDPRTIHVRRPDAPGALHPLGELGDGAVATSATYFSAPDVATPEDGAAGRSPLVDPRTRRPLADARSFSVVASRCMAADALTKVLALGGAMPAAWARRWDAQGFVL